jgi:microcystin-dependent protein
MAEPFLAEVRLFSFDFPPKGWAMCNGQLLPINQNQALFSLLGTSYGGDGRVNFALPDNRGRTPIHVGNGYNLGQSGGEQSHTLSISELPTHTHILRASSVGATTNVPSNTTPWGNTSPTNVYNDAGSNLVAMKPAVIANIGGNQPHLNMQPYLVINFCIALQGIFPSQF